MAQWQPTAMAFLHIIYPLLLAGGDSISLVVEELALELAAGGGGSKGCEGGTRNSPCLSISKCRGSKLCSCQAMGGSMKEVLYIWIPVALLTAIRAVPHEDYILEGHAPRKYSLPTMQGSTRCDGRNP